ncbi:MAG TPA: CBS domain-containing protein, partial [Thiothrix sp.]|nr:CBS domain-containing protein [Thiothrix sp.]
MMQQSLSVRYYMNPNFLTLKVDQDIHEVIALFNAKRLFGAPVVDNVGNVIGILSGTDCIRAAVKYGFH